MSYPVGSSIPYAASASTPGLPSDTFTYSWAFDDGGTGVNASLNHTWGTTGAHSATVTATDTNTLGTATASKSVQIDPYTWANIGSSSILPKANSIGLQLSSNLIMLAGGLGSGITNTTILFNGSSWSYGPSMVKQRYIPYYSTGASCKLGDGTWLVAGGTYVLGGGYTDGSGRTTEIFDPVANHFTLTGALNISRGGGGCLLSLPSGNAAIFGGSGGGDKSFEIYNTTSKTWAIEDQFHYQYTIPGTAGPDSGTQMTGLTLSDGRLFIIDNDVTYQQGITCIYTESSNSWTIGPYLAGFDSLNQRPFIIQNGNYVYIGGYDDVGQQYFSRYDLTANTWTRLADCPYPMGDLPAIGMTHGIMVYGTSANTPLPSTISSYYYNYASNTWTAYSYAVTTLAYLQYTLTPAMTMGGYPLILLSTDGLTPLTAEIFQGS